MDFLNFNSAVTGFVAMPSSIETIPGFEAQAAFTVSSASVFKEDVPFIQLTSLDEHQDAKQVSAPNNPTRNATDNEQ